MATVANGPHYSNDLLIRRLKSKSEQKAKKAMTIEADRNDEITTFRFSVSSASLLLFPHRLLLCALSISLNVRLNIGLNIRSDISTTTSTSQLSQSARRCVECRACGPGLCVECSPVDLDSLWVNGDARV